VVITAMRSEKPADLLKLARALAASAEGMTLDEMAEFSGVGRRTIERRRDAIEDVFGPLDRIDDGRMVRFRMNGRGLGSFANAPTSEELAELENAIRDRVSARDPSRAEILQSLHQKIRASLRGAERMRLETDIDARLRAEAFARQVGPRPYADPKILATLRNALLAGVMVKFLYGEDSDAALRWRKVIPYGLIFAPRFYFVARIKSKPEPVLFRLDRMHDLEITNEPGAPPETFDLEAYAARSFGVFQEEAEDIVLRFDPSAAPDARAYLFHPTQTMTDEPDGSLTVRFRAAGLLQIAHHLMTWGPTVAILAPDRLKEMMWGEVEALYEHCRKMRRKPRTAKVAAE
jgi:predicted DNA-binding transcriptional regulator YafY